MNKDNGNMIENGVELSTESLRMVEAGKAAHQAVIEMAEQRRVRIEELEQEHKLLGMEADRLRLDVHDLKDRLASVITDNQKLEAARTAYETLTVLIARQLTEFVPPVPPAYAHRPEVFRDAEPDPVKSPQDAAKETLAKLTKALAN